MDLLKQSTARNIPVFMTDVADHVTGKTGLTLTITAGKDGSAFASVTPTVTERGNGWYWLALTAGHTDTPGGLIFHVTGTGADPTDVKCQVVADLPGASVASVVGNVGGNVGGSVASVTNAVVLPTIPANWITAAGVAATALNGKGDWLLSSGYTAPPSAATVAVAVVDQTLAGHTGAGTVGGALNAAGAAGDPWTSLFASYGVAGTFGNLIGSVFGSTLSALPAAVRDVNNTNPAANSLGAGINATFSAAGSAATSGTSNATLISGIKTKTDSLTFTTANKVDAKLTADGLDNIAATAPTALATTFSGKMLQVWERFFGKVVKDDNAGTLKVMQGTGATAQTTQNYTSAAGMETLNKAT